MAGAFAYVAPQYFLVEMNFTELLDDAVVDWPKKKALIEMDNSVSRA